MRRHLALAAGALAAVLLLAGCTGAERSDSDGPVDGPNTLRVLAGSEVKDMLPILEDAKRATGVDVQLQYSGTLEGTELVASGGASAKYDATWFPNNRYLSLLPDAQSRIGTSVKIMSSPVVLGLKRSVVQRLGWDTTPPTWGDIAQAAGAGEFTYAMTNPAASNSGFSALVSVATALSGTGSALTDADIDAVTPKLTSFFSAQKLTAGSSGYLADKVKQDPDAVDGLVNYESVLDGFSGGSDPLQVVTPTDGVVTSDYPLTLLSSAASSKRALFDKVTTWLTSTDVQKRIVRDVHRRPGVPGIDTGSAFPQTVLFETPFPNTLDTADRLIATYLNTVRAPAQTIFVLDTSGSMGGDRIDDLRTALKNLAGADTSTTGGFAEFRNRERVTLIPFNDRTGAPTTIEVPATDKGSALKRIRSAADGLEADGGTAIYSSLEEAYDVALQQKAERPDTFVSIVLMTDGENNDGASAADFTRDYRSLGSDAAGIPTFTVLFGDGDRAELTDIAKLTGGQVFDALNGDLTGAFQEIRGYQ